MQQFRPTPNLLLMITNGDPSPSASTPAISDSPPSRYSPIGYYHIPGFGVGRCQKLLKVSQHAMLMLTNQELAPSAYQCNTWCYACLSADASYQYGPSGQVKSCKSDTHAGNESAPHTTLQQQKQNRSEPLFKKQGSCKKPAEAEQFCLKLWHVASVQEVENRGHDDVPADR